MKLLSDKRAPNPRRVRIFLAEKGISDQVEVITLSIDAGDTLTDEFQQKNPLGWLPLLELDDGTIIAESIAICRYLEALHPSPPLFGEDALGRAAVDQWIRHIEFEVMVPVMQAFRNGHAYWKGRIEQVPEYAPFAVKLARSRFDWLEDELAKRPWIAGESFSVADIAALSAIDFGKLSNIRIGDERPNLADWYKRINERPSAKA